MSVVSDAHVGDVPVPPSPADAVQQYCWPVPPGTLLQTSVSSPWSGVSPFWHVKPHVRGSGHDTVGSSVQPLPPLHGMQQ